MNNTFKKRIDDLGRIVIPKEIRNEFKIKNFDEIELFIDNNLIVMRKSNEIERYKEKFNSFFSLLKELVDIDFIITNNSHVVSSTLNDIKENDLLNIDLNKVSINQLFDGDLVKSKRLKKYIFIESIIVESNMLGYFIVLKDTVFLDEITFLKKVKNTIINLIN